MADVQSNIQLIRTNGFYEEGERVRPELFDQIARDLGKAFAQRGGPGVSSSQLRNFYTEVKALEIRLQEMSRDAPDAGQGATENEQERVDIAASVYQNNEYLVRMVAPKIAYIQGKRTGGNVSREFRDYIEASLDKVHSARDFEVFMRLFESVVGFFYGYGGGKN